MAQWSDQQRQIRVDILSCNAEKWKEMKQKRNELLRAIRDRVRYLRMEALKDKLSFSS